MWGTRRAPTSVIVTTTTTTELGGQLCTSLRQCNTSFLRCLCLQLRVCDAADLGTIAVTVGPARVC